MNDLMPLQACRAAVDRRQIIRMPDYKIDISSRQSALTVDSAFLKRVVTDVLRDECVAQAYVSIAIVDNPTIRSLNRKHLNHDFDTDVLSFLLECHDTSQLPGSTNLAPSPRRGMGKRLEGEVIASADMARDRAAEFNHAPLDELTLYIVHGLLHLIGYDDQTPDEEIVMRSREKEILARLKEIP